jgi:hypothetical protein
MKKGFFFFILSIFYLPTFAQADFSGHWRGPGKLIYEAMDCERDCTFDFQFQQNPQEIKVLKGDIVCDEFTQLFDPFIVSIQGEELWWNGQPVGTLHGNVFKAQYNHDGTVSDYLMEINGNQLQYTQKIKWDGGPSEMVLTGRLPKID